jgi:HB1, ASXL, restriction endonuclease HTH domain
MADVQKPSDPYEIVLADLRAKRAKIDHAIAALEGMRADAPSAAAPAETDQVQPGEISPGMFLGMNIADAARKLLAIRKKPLTTPEVLEGLISGGVAFRGKAPRNVVGSILHRHSGNDIVSIARGKWGLKEWYPNRSFKPGSKANNGLEPRNETSEPEQPS